MKVMNVANIATMKVETYQFSTKADLMGMFVQVYHALSSVDPVNGFRGVMLYPVHCQYFVKEELLTTLDGDYSAPTIAQLLTDNWNINFGKFYISLDEVPAFDPDEIGFDEEV